LSLSAQDNCRPPTLKSGSVFGRRQHIAPIAAQERQDLLELLDDRVGSRSTLITSQLPTSAWHQWLNEPTIADAIMDRLLHGSHTIALKGESLRRATPQA
jgi:DNA replication protein DnaC